MKKYPWIGGRYHRSTFSNSRHSMTHMPKNWFLQEKENFWNYLLRLKITDITEAQKYRNHKWFLIADYHQDSETESSFETITPPHGARHTLRLYWEKPKEVRSGLKFAIIIEEVIPLLKETE